MIRTSKIIVRGIIDNKGNVHFYVGSDFHVDLEAEQRFFDH